MRTLYLLSGGGIPGLDIHVGIWQALQLAGLNPRTGDEIHGTSAGAAIGALMAFGRQAGEVEYLVRGLDERRIRDERPFWRLRIPWIDSFLGHDGIRAVLDSELPSTFEALKHPFTCYATNNLTRECLAFHRGGTAGLREAVLASLSIRGVFPSVRIGDFGYSDGGSRQQLPLPANRKDFDRIVAMIAAPPVKYRAGNLSIIGGLLWSLHTIFEDRIQDTIDTLADEQSTGRRFVCLRPNCGADADNFRFDHSLIPQARQQAMTQLEAQLGVRI